jgi:integrase
MAKLVKQLKDLQVKRLSKPGSYPDGEGLYIQIRDSGAKDWFYRYEIGGRGRKRGLGSYPTISLEKARDEALLCRQLRKKGIDPIDYYNDLATKKNLEKAKSTTFKECALAYINTHKHGWRNEKHESQWRNTLETYAYPFIGNLPVQVIDIDLVMKVLEPIWFDKTETASRVRQRIENILDWATVRNLRQGDNPALWRGRLDKLLPKRSKIQKPKHFAAMDYRVLPEYFKSLREKDTIASKALAFTILTATRNGEARAATRPELDDKANAWVIPDNRMKAGREHRIPLSKEASDIIKEMEPFKKVTVDFIFPGLAKGKPINEAALMKLLKKDHPTLTIHGFRSSFRDWCAEQTNYPREVAEAALAHTIKDKTEAAYQRGDMFEKRRKLMNAWAEYCLNDKGNSEVVPINKAVS